MQWVQRSDGSWGQFGYDPNDTTVIAQGLQAPRQPGFDFYLPPTNGPDPRTETEMWLGQPRAAAQAGVSPDQRLGPAPQIPSAGTPPALSTALDRRFGEAPQIGTGVPGQPASLAQQPPIGTSVNPAAGQAPPAQQTYQPQQAAPRYPVYGNEGVGGPAHTTAWQNPYQDTPAPATGQFPLPGDKQWDHRYQDSTYWQPSGRTSVGVNDPQFTPPADWQGVVTTPSGWSQAAVPPMNDQALAGQRAVYGGEPNWQWNPQNQPLSYQPQPGAGLAPVYGNEGVGGAAPEQRPLHNRFAPVHGLVAAAEQPAPQYQIPQRNRGQELAPNPFAQQRITGGHTYQSNVSQFGQSVSDPVLPPGSPFQSIERDPTGLISRVQVNGKFYVWNSSLNTWQEVK